MFINGTKSAPPKRSPESAVFREKREKENKKESQKETGEVWTALVREDAPVLFTLFEW